MAVFVTLSVSLGDGVRPACHPRNDQETEDCWRRNSMRPLVMSFHMFFRQVFHDSMLVMVCAASTLAALFIRVGIPEIESALCNFYNRPAILSDYYLLFDMLLALVTPYMLCFASAMMMLSEYDENITNYLCVTPVGKRGYIISRLIIPASISFFASVLIMLLCTLTDWQFYELLLVCALASILSVAASLLIVSFSHNRVEGMALGKLTGIVMLGLPVPFFLPSAYQYLFSPLPSFWIAKFCIENENSIVYLFFAVLSLIIWSVLLYRKFIRKVM
jgi:fluoroquinolone transport system permease protein